MVLDCITLKNKHKGFIQNRSILLTFDMHDKTGRTEQREMFCLPVSFFIRNKIMVMVRTESHVMNNSGITIHPEGENYIMANTY